LTVGCNPESSITITQQPSSPQLLMSTGNGIVFHFPINQPLDSFARTDQKSAVGVFTKISLTIRAVQRVKGPRSRLPSYYSVYHYNPDIAVFIFVQTAGASANSSVLSSAISLTFLNATEPAGWNPY